jgi:four helix bundle protein
MRDLARYEVLTRAKDLAVDSYGLTTLLPDSERFGLTAQINRASVSVAANIAEGLGRGTAGDLERHLRIALGSAAELDVLLEIADRVHHLPPQELTPFGANTTVVRKQLNLLIGQVAGDRQLHGSRPPERGGEPAANQ